MTFSLATVVSLTVGLFLFCEVVLRLIGQQVLRAAPVHVVEPGGSLYVTHPKLGYMNRPGTYRVTVRDSLFFTLTHRADGLRITRPFDAPPPAPGTPQLWILGGSFTHGWAVNDHEAYPWRLQERLLTYDVANFGVDGYGTIHALIQMEEALAQGKRPAAVVVAYASFHDERNLLLRQRRKALFLWNRLGDLRQPYARLTANAGLEIHRATVSYREFPLTRHSAFIHALERLYNWTEERRSNSHAISKALMLALAEQCRAHGIALIVAGIYDDTRTADMLNFCRERGIPSVNIAVDLSLRQYNSRPYDSHPSALAHKHYAIRLHTFLTNRLPNPSLFHGVSSMRIAR